MKKYQLRIKEPNKVIQIRGRNIRTPLVTVLNEDEISLIRSLIKYNSITNYDIEELDIGRKEIKRVVTNFEEILKKQRKEEKEFNYQAPVEVGPKTPTEIAEIITDGIKDLDDDTSDDITVLEGSNNKDVVIEELEEVSILKKLASGKGMNLK